MSCPACGFDNPIAARYCGRCGAPLGIECRSCGTPVAPGLVYCTSCGAGLAESEERKVVTVLFADLVEFTRRAGRLDPEEVRQLLAPYHARLRSELERFGGTVEKFIGDAVVALFGAPSSHEDDPVRGVRAALAIREAIAELNAAEPGLDLHVRIAVTTGEVVVALGARPSEGEGMAAGDVLNTASRLQAAAPVDGILVDAVTHRTTAGEIEYRDAQAVEAKGKPQPIPVWEAVSAQRQPRAEILQLRRGRFVGRRSELDSLRESLNRARLERSVQLVTLVGESGIGKSRLVYEFAQSSAEDPDPPAWQLGRSLPYGDGVTYWALGEIVKGQAAILETDAAREARVKLHSAVGAVLSEPAEADWVEGHLRSLAGLGGEGEVGADRRSEAFAAWRRFVEALAARRPLVLVFEDLHWADDGLLDFIDHLVEWATGAPLLIVCTARLELLERRPGWSETRENALTLSLEALTDSETSVLVGSLLVDNVLPERARLALLSRAGGNPLYATEYVRMLVDQGLVGPGAERADEAELPLPGSVQAIIAARLDALPAGEKALLQAAAVIGKAFWAGAIVAISGAPRWRVEEQLLGLERKGFVRRDRRSSVARETQYSFWHILIRDVAYGQIPRRRRADDHRLAAVWIESLNVERAEDRAEMLAYHYMNALELARALGRETKSLRRSACISLREAGDRATSLNAFQAAFRFYRGALDLLPEDDPERSQLLFQYGQALFHAESRGDEVLTDAREALLAAGDIETAAEAIVILGELMWMRGEADIAFVHLEGAVALLGDSPPSRAKVHVLSSLARFLMIAGRNERAVGIGREALQMAEELGLDELRAHALDSIGAARARIGDPGGVADLEQSIAIAAELNSIEAVRGYVNLGTTLADLGDLARAFELYDRGRRAAERFGHHDRIRWFEEEQLYEWYWRGDWGQALRRANEVIAELEGGDPNMAELDARLVRARVLLAKGAREEALQDSASALEFARRVGYPEALFPALAFQARVLAAAGDSEEAAARARELLGLWRGNASAAASFWTVDLACGLWMLGRGNELLAAQEWVLARTRWLDAAEAFSRGELARAADLYADIGTGPDEAFARLQAAVGAREDRKSESQAQLDRALAFFRRAGAEAYVREAEALTVV